MLRSGRVAVDLNANTHSPQDPTEQPNSRFYLILYYETCTERRGTRVFKKIWPKECFSLEWAENHLCQSMLASLRSMLWTIDLPWSTESPALHWILFLPVRWAKVRVQRKPQEAVSTLTEKVQWQLHSSKTNPFPWTPTSKRKSDIVVKVHCTSSTELKSD